jgi:hypothetical protein
MTYSAALHNLGQVSCSALAVSTAAADWKNTSSRGTRCNTAAAAAAATVTNLHTALLLLLLTSNGGLNLSQPPKLHTALLLLVLLLPFLGCAALFLLGDRPPAMAAAAAVMWPHVHTA